MVRHRLAVGDEYAVHDVYFDTAGRVVTHSADALSPREASVPDLREAIRFLIRKAEGKEVRTGDLGYTYTWEDLETWLACLELPPIDGLE